MSACPYCGTDTPLVDMFPADVLEEVKRRRERDPNWPDAAPTTGDTNG